ncbi:hypothetical protein AOQ84DRAFT_349299 [Glonium stellatum]|uniref:FAS1 domain-containing protein n=1 Tax=Glonium stellatum TaxID=574774 RepID=A0A8E2JM09_9PEZI|nr:hypothetical protein AOQ84DRAFT_349299 [Glonium stellatum]
MKPSLLLTYNITCTCFIFIAFAQSRPLSSFFKSLHVFSNGQQYPLAHPPNIVMPSSAGDNPATDVPSGIMISDVMGKTQSIAIFSGLTRDIDSVSDRLDDPSRNATVLAPNNGAMRSLSRKPWEDPKEYETLGEDAYHGQAGEDRAHRNMRKFVEAHIVPESPWREHQKVETLAGNIVWFENKGSKKLIQPGDIEVISVADKVANGEVWILQDVVNSLQYH